MTKFKVGDKVRVVDPKWNDRYFKRGALGTVIAADGQDALHVQFTAGDFDTGCGGKWWTSHDCLEHCVPYSATFTEAIKAEAQQGHTADGGGLQKHSIGDLYPLCVVGYAKDVGTTAWVIENLQRGQVACTSGGSVRQWAQFREAAAFAEHAALHKLDRMGEPIVWLAGRPVFEKYALLVLNTAQG